MPNKELIDGLLKKTRRLLNTIESNHSTDALKDCHNCASKPVRYWSHWGSWIVCDCGQIIFADSANENSVDILWERLNGE